jgi:beta-glucosidase
VSGGSGSGRVNALHPVSVLDGIKTAAPKATVIYHPGLQKPLIAQWLGRGTFASPVTTDWLGDANGTSLGTATSDKIQFDAGKTKSIAGFEGGTGVVRWTTSIQVPTAGKYTFMVRTNAGIRLTVDNQPALDVQPAKNNPLLQADLDLTANQPHTLVLEASSLPPNANLQFGYGPTLAPGEFFGQDTLDKAAQSADIIIACVGFGQSADTNSIQKAYFAHWPSPEFRGQGIVEAEDSDRPFALPAPQVETLRRLGALHKKMIVILNAGAGVDLEGWQDQVPALICAWYPGQEGGTALAEIISGATNPSAKLPVTFAKRYEDYPSAPYYKINDHGHTPYTEGVNVGYRGFDANKVDPEFCFGYGLSYTSFGYDNLKIEPLGTDKVQVSFSIKNTGTRAGAEVAEVYVTPAAGTVSRPPKELKGFSKVQLNPGESRPVEVTLDSRAFSYWSLESKQWTIDPGHYGILIGASSRDIRLQGTVDR